MERYVKSAHGRKKIKDAQSVAIWPAKKRGAPLKVGLEVEKELLRVLEDLAAAGCDITELIIRSNVRAIMEADCPDKLLAHGGEITIKRSWSQSFCRREDFVTRVKTTDTLKKPSNYEAVKEAFLGQARKLQDEYHVPAELWSNADEVGQAVFPISLRTLAKQGSSQVGGAAVKNKQQVTKMNLITASGQVGPLTMIFQGKTDAVHPKSVQPPPGSRWDHSDRHFQNYETFARWSRQYVAYADSVRQSRAASATTTTEEQRAKELVQVAVLILDNHSSHQHPKTLEYLTQNRIKILWLPPNCTAFLQPCDVNFNGLEKQVLRNDFREWYTNEVVKQRMQFRRDLKAGKLAADAKFIAKSPLPETAADIRAFIAKLCVGAHEKMKKRSKIVFTAWAKTGLYDIIHGRPYIEDDEVIENDAEVLDLVNVSLPQLLDELAKQQQETEGTPNRKSNEKVTKNKEDEENDEEDNEEEQDYDLLDQEAAGGTNNIAEDLVVDENGNIRGLTEQEFQEAQDQENLLAHDSEVQASRRTRIRSRAALHRRSGSSSWGHIMFNSEKRPDGTKFVVGKWIGDARLPATELLTKHGKLTTPEQFNIIEEISTGFTFNLDVAEGISTWIFNNSNFVWPLAS